MFVNWLHLRTCLPASNSGLHRTNHNGKVSNWFEGTFNALQSTVSKKSNSHVSYNKLSESSLEQLAGMTGDPNWMLSPWA